MTELTDLSDTDALNTAVTGNSVEGNVANMGGTDDVIQAILGMLSRFRNANVFRLRDNSDNTKLLAFDLSAQTTGQTVTLKTGSDGGLALTSTDAGATVGPVLELYRNSASPASNDILGQILFNGEDSAGNTQEYGSIQAVISDATSGSEDGALAFYAPIAGARTLISTMGPITGFAGRGTGTNDLAAAGFVGEFVSNSATTGTLGSGSDTNITSIALTAGDWDITAGYSASGTGTPSVTDVWVSINTSSASSVNTAGQSARTRGVTMTDPLISGAIGPLRVSLSGNATYYLNTTCTYTGGGATFAVNGLLRARRIR